MPGFSKNGVTVQNLNWYESWNKKWKVLFRRKKHEVGVFKETNRDKQIGMKNRDKGETNLKFCFCWVLPERPHHGGKFLEKRKL